MYINITIPTNPHIVITDRQIIVKNTLVTIRFINVQQSVPLRGGRHMGGVLDLVKKCISKYVIQVYKMLDLGVIVKIDKQF